MKSKIGFLVVTSLFIGAHSFAQEVQRSETEQKTDEEKYTVGVTNFALRPSAGAVFFEGEQRFTGGVLMDVNVLSTPVVKVGPSFGALYSSLGGGADFFDGISTSNDAYIFQIPANIKVTASPDPSRRLQLGVHGGANIVRSNSATGVFGNEILEGVETASWDVHPNVGGDIDFALGTNADLTLRPDVTFLPAFNMTTLTLGLGLKL